MTLGWTATDRGERAPEALDPQPRRARRKGLLWLGVGLVLSLLGTAVGVFWGINRAGDRAHERRQSALAEVATVPGDLIDDLQNERNLSSLTLTGLVGAVELAVDTLDEARLAVDDSYADFEQAVLDNEAAVGAYRESLGALEELAAVRADVDHDEGPADLSNLPVALRVYDTYTDVIAALLDGTTRLVVSFDQGELRSGVELIHLTSRQIETVTVLITRLVFAAVEYEGRLLNDRGEAVDRELVAEIRWLSGEFRRRRDEIGELGTSTGTYEDATIKALEESDEWGFEDLVASILEGETYSAVGFLTDISSDPDAGYRGLRATIEDIIRARTSASA